MLKPTISVITTTFNSASTVDDTIQSVLKQNYPQVEHIIIDGGSNDNTLDIVKKYTHLKWISEPDEGLYYGMNKGLNLATGEIIGILNSDDLYANENVLSQVVTEIGNADGLLSNISIFDGPTGKTVRNYSAVKWKKWMFRIGWQPPHPGAFFRSSVYKKHGHFNTKYRISADFDILFRFIYHHKISYVKSNFQSVKMRAGGLSQSGFKNLKIANNEDNQAIKSYGYFSFNLLIYTKYILKMVQFIK